MKNLIFIIAMLLVSTGSSWAQVNGIFTKIRVLDSLWLNGSWIKHVSDDEELSEGAANILPSQLAIKGAINRLRNQIEDSLNTLKGNFVRLSDGSQTQSGSFNVSGKSVIGSGLTIGTEEYGEDGLNIFNDSEAQITLKSRTEPFEYRWRISAKPSQFSIAKGDNNNNMLFRITNDLNSRFFFGRVTEPTLPETFQFNGAMRISQGGSIYSSISSPAALTVHSTTSVQAAMQVGIKSMGANYNHQYGVVIQGKNSDTKVAPILINPYSDGGRTQVAIGTPYPKGNLTIGEGTAGATLNFYVGDATKIAEISPLAANEVDPMDFNVKTSGTLFLGSSTTPLNKPTLYLHGSIVYGGIRITNSTHSGPCTFTSQIFQWIITYPATLIELPDTPTYFGRVVRIANYTNSAIPTNFPYVNGYGTTSSEIGSGEMVELCMAGGTWYRVR